jgi:hypothetical protein
MPLSRIQTTLFSGETSDSVLRSLFAPPVPTGVTATAGNTQATVVWSAPTVLTQTPITDYTVQYSSNSGSTWATFTRSASTSTTATVTGLTNGQGYIFRVAAINAIGTGAYTEASSVVLIGLVPQKAWVSAISTDGLFDGSVPNSATIGTPARITDDNIGTGAGAVPNYNFAPTVYPTYIQIDLGAVRQITGIYIRGLNVPGYWSQAYTANRIIRVSVDGVTWSTYATTGSNLTNLTSYGGVATCRYIQLYQSSGEYMAVSEFYPAG